MHGRCLGVALLPEGEVRTRVRDGRGREGRKMARDETRRARVRIHRIPLSEGPPNSLQAPRTRLLRVVGRGDAATAPGS